MRHVILASGSPRRIELLKKAGLKFKVEKSNISEKIISGASPRQAVINLAEQKAGAVAKKHKDALIIAADTIVTLKGKILGKPKTAKQATKMLAMLSGECHSVFTAFTIINTKNNKKNNKVFKTKVYFNKLTEAEIKKYVLTKEPLDKAGAYAIQGKGIALIKKIEGDYSNVIGLPINELIKTLKKFN